MLLSHFNNFHILFVYKNNDNVYEQWKEIILMARRTTKN